MLEYKWCINTSKCCDRKKRLGSFFQRAAVRCNAAIVQSYDSSLSIQLK